MPKGPHGQKRPADMNQLAKRIVDIATGEAEEDSPASEGKDAKAVSRGKLGGVKGGKARKDALTPERRKQIALAAARARWGTTERS